MLSLRAPTLSAHTSAISACPKSDHPPPNLHTIPDLPSRSQPFPPTSWPLQCNPVNPSFSNPPPSIRTCVHAGRRGKSTSTSTHTHLVGPYPLGRPLKCNKKKTQQGFLAPTTTLSRRGARQSIPCTYAFLMRLATLTRRWDLISRWWPTRIFMNLRVHDSGCSTPDTATPPAFIDLMLFMIAFTRYFSCA